jgi:hypothetical protein
MCARAREINSDGARLRRAYDEKIAGDVTATIKTMFTMRAARRTLNITAAMHLQRS